MNLDDLLLHKQTLKAVKGYLKSPPQALLILAPEGSGKRTLAGVLTAKLLNIPTAKIEDYPYYIHLQKPPDKQDIPIDEVRQLTRSLKLKIPGSQNIARVVFIEDARNLSGEAQNALLKMLER